MEEGKIKEKEKKIWGMGEETGENGESKENKKEGEEGEKKIVRIGYRSY